MKDAVRCMRVGDDEWNEWRGLAKARGISASELVRESVRYFCAVVSESKTTDNATCVPLKSSCNALQKRGVKSSKGGEAKQVSPQKSAKSIGSRKRLGG